MQKSKKKKRLKFSERGNTMIELVVAVGVGLLMMGAIVVMSMSATRGNKHASQDHQAILAAQEGLAAMSSIDFNDLSPTENGKLNFSGSQWQVGGPGPNNLPNGLSRRIRVKQVYRGPGCTIVDSGGELDPNTLKLESEISWTNINGQSQQITLSSYRTRWANPVENCFPISSCYTLTPTIYVNESNIIVGGPGNGDTYSGSLVGTNDADIIFGTDEADDINANQGNDIVCGFDGDDVINGFHGDDLIFGGGGNDVLKGGMHRDIIYGGAGNDNIDGGHFSDILCGGRGDDIIQGGKDTEDSDLLDGGSGYDDLDGEKGEDVCVNAEVLKRCEDTTTPIPDCDKYTYQ